MLKTKHKIAIGAVCLLGVFALGRYTVPTKIKIETKTIESKIKNDKTNVSKKRKKKTVITETTTAQGEKRKETVITDDTDTDKNHQSTQASTKETQRTEEKTTGRDQLHLSLLAGLDLTSPTPVYGLSITKPIVGPITVGIWGLTNANVGFSLGIAF